MQQDPRPWRHLYKRRACTDLARAQKAREPLCKYCLKRGFANDGSLTASGAPQASRRRRHVAADHIVPHKGDEALFFDPDNLQTLCPDDHDRNRQREELHGFSQERGPDGWPLDPRHPANR
ncbi:HNH endonuclease [Jannaschia faecimaris]|uniref:HNH endonuclease n=1 Tax=Jannaschia faecimaris TaxID=1244108 RepID=A0A1H3U3P0_9RHOB|nr:HNH endonuclease signature motif containing protein [Jannaschia faecimaris]SDZ57073.1 HNH endonuclease [Jannaschia faecimaris]